jgi:hypothetical protein
MLLVCEGPLPVVTAIAVGLAVDKRKSLAVGLCSENRSSCDYVLWNYKREKGLVDLIIHKNFSKVLQEIIVQVQLNDTSLHCPVNEEFPICYI